MGLVQRIRQNKWFKIFTNRYVFALLVFIIWMLFLDANSFLIHRELSKEIDDLQDGIEFYQTELEKNKKELEELESNPEKLEKFAREKYWLHKDGEEVTLIEIIEE